MCQEEEQLTKPSELEPSTKMREGEKSKTGPQMDNGSVARLVAMKGVRLSTDETDRRLREILQQDRRKKIVYGQPRGGHEDV